MIMEERMLTPRLFLVYMIIFSSATVSPASAFMSWFRKRPMQNVTVINEIESRATMITNCRTIFFDYKIKDIPYEESFSFSFVPDVWGTTAYWCKFTWNDTMSRKEVSAVLLVFDALKDDEKHCAPECRWRISSTGYRFWDGFLSWGTFSVRRLK
jgi:hypothetical protein